MDEAKEARQINLILKEIKKHGQGHYSFLVTLDKEPIGNNIFSKLVREKLTTTQGLGISAGMYHLEKREDVVAAGGWIDYLKEEENKKNAIEQKQRELDNRAIVAHEKTLLDIKKLQGDIERGDLQTAVFKGQIETLQNANRYFWVPYAISAFALIFSVWSYIDTRSMHNEEKQKQDSKYNTPATQATKPALLKSVSVDSEKVKSLK